MKRTIFVFLTLILPAFFAVPVSAQTAQPTGCPRSDAGAVCLGSGGSPSEVAFVVDGTTFMRVTRAGVWTFPNSATLSTPTITTPTITTPAITGGTIAGTTQSASVLSDYKVLATSITYTSNTTLATITGFSWTVVAGGTYVFEVNIPATMTTNAGLKVGFKLTTATLTSIQYQTYAATASDNTTGVSTQGTTTTDQTTPFSSKTAAYTLVTIKGSFVVGTGGTFAWQAAQETSGSGGDVSIALLGAYAKLYRVL